MLKKTFLFIAFFSVLLFRVLAKPSPAENLAVEYLCEFGVTFYNQGRYEEALSEFKKVLILQPNNQIAAQYVSDIFERELPPALPKPVFDHTKEQELIAEVIPEEPKKNRSREEALDNAFRNLDKEESKAASKEKESKKKKAPVALSGEYRLGAGFTSKDFIWKDANADKVGVPHEKNWRYLWGDQRHNTYDAKIYDRFKLDMQTQFDIPLNAFMEVTIDPWTFIGKNEVSVISASGDTADLNLKYWSNDSRTINELYRSRKGDIVNLKEIKVVDDKTTVSGLTITPTNTAFGQISPLEIDREYRPFRKFWFDYKDDDYTVKFFPLSDQLEAQTTDDPLRISNNRIYWEESPWLDAYEPSRTFEKAGTPIKRGKWIRSLSYFTRDSSDDYPRRLTFLRGLSFKTNDSLGVSLESTVATPMSLWDEFDNVNSAEAAVRLKVPLAEAFTLGFSSTSKVGINRASTEAWNQVEGVDLNYQLSPWYSLYAEAAESHTSIQEAKEFNSDYDGVGAKLGASFNAAEDIKKGVYKGEVYAAHMDGKFYPALSNYRYTRRDDPTFSRHIYFVQMRDDDKSTVWGDGMDRGRNVIGFNLNAKFLEEALDADFRYRNVHRDSGKYIESVLRSESSYQVSPRLSAKLLVYYENLPLTHANLDPLLYNKTMYALTDYFSEDDSHPINNAIVDGKDPSVGAFGLGGKYDLIEKLVSLEGIYEFTNDPLDFPRVLLNDLSVTTELDDGRLFDKVVPFLYDQRFFDLPPYSYYNIAKAKLFYTPAEDWEFILSYTFNDNRYATGIDDNINHAGLEATYTPSKKWTLWFKYIFSQLIDVYKQNQFQRSDFYEGHHNFFFGSEYNLNPDSALTLLYGEFVGYGDPYEQASWTLSALDTQHIFRLFYKRKF